MTAGRFFNITSDDLGALRAAFSPAAPAGAAGAAAIPAFAAAEALTASVAGTREAPPEIIADNDVVSRAFLAAKLHLLLEDPESPVLRNEQSKGVAERFGKALPLRRPPTAPNGPVDVPKWLERFERYAAMTCAIRLPDQHLGSGFLVGPDLVLTARHLMERALPATGGNLRDVRIIFDQQLGSNGIVTRATDTASVEKVLVESEELDFVVVQLSSQPGYQELPTGTRSWVDLPRQPVVILPNMYISALHRPHPDVLLYSPGFVCRENGEMIEYTSIMLPGSSGGGVYGMNWELLAVHNRDVAERDVLDLPCTAGVKASLIAAAVREANNGFMPERAPFRLEID
jgi:hypothetical protein